MSKKQTPKYLIYNYISNNNLEYYNNKTYHSTHYDENVMYYQYNRGMVKYFNHPDIEMTPPINIIDSFTAVVERRKSSRDFHKNKEISKKELSTLLHYASGYINDEKTKKHIASSGGFCSVEIFMIVLSSSDVEEGTYYYSPEKNKIYLLEKGNFREWIKNDVFYQSEISNSSVIFVLAADVKRLSYKYGEKSYRLALLDIGHVSHNLYLTSTAINLKVTAIAGFIESEMVKAFKMDEGVIPLLTLAIGK